MGTLNHLITGRCEFKDEANGITAFYEIGNCGKKLAKDYFKGQIMKHDKVVSEISGNYMGYVDFDNKRYWDVRDMVNYEPVPIPKTETHTPLNPKSFPVLLPSDANLRMDSLALLAGDVEQAQINKNNMEELQRNDRKLREAA